MSISPTLREAGTEPASERRASPRRSVLDRRLVTVSLDNKDAGLMVDISEAGMAVQALARIKPGAATSLQFELPDTPGRIQASGTVAWVDETSGRAGIRFHNLPEASAACLKQWMDRRTSVKRAAPPAAPPPVAAPSMPGPESRVAEIAAIQREITSQGLDSDAALALIVQRIRGLTRADGAAIVLGDSKLMTCRAATGSAPPAGVELRPEAGISGECVRTGVTVRCEDAELDPRVDREACRSINLRSAVIVPLFARGNISGLVEVFYSSPRAFDGRDVLLLRRMADLVSATLCGPVSRDVKPPATMLPAERTVSPAPLIPPIPGAVSKPARVVCNICGHENALASSACQKCEGPLAESAVAESAAADLGRTSLGSATAERKPWLTLRLNASPRLLALIAVLLLLLGLWGWREYKSHEERAAPPENTTLDAGPPSSVSTAAPIGSFDPPFPPANLPSSGVPPSQSIAAATKAKSGPPLVPQENVTTPTARSAAKPSAGKDH